MDTSRMTDETIQGNVNQRDAETEEDLENGRERNSITYIMT
jgi:hypothetical protein